MDADVLTKINLKELCGILFSSNIMVNVVKIWKYLFFIVQFCPGSISILFDKICKFSVIQYFENEYAYITHRADIFLLLLFMYIYILYAFTYFDWLIKK